MKGSMPSWAVQEAGAPAEVWVDIQAPEDSDSLYLDVIWVNKTATRLPEVSQLAWGCQVCGGVVGGGLGSGARRRLVEGRGSGRGFGGQQIACYTGGRRGGGGGVEL